MQKFINVPGIGILHKNYGNLLPDIKMLKLVWNLQSITNISCGTPSAALLWADRAKERLETQNLPRINSENNLAAIEHRRQRLLRKLQDLSKEQES